jgi:hypothetical protein
VTSSWCDEGNSESSPWGWGDLRDGSALTDRPVPGWHRTCKRADAAEEKRKTEMRVLIVESGNIDASSSSCGAALHDQGYSIERASDGA